MKTPDLKSVNWKDVFIGDYDWAFLCTPRLPWAKSKQPPPFYAKDEKISVFVAFIMGLQHCLAMVSKGGKGGTDSGLVALQYCTVVYGTDAVVAFIVGLQHCLALAKGAEGVHIGAWWLRIIIKECGDGVGLYSFMALVPLGPMVQCLGAVQQWYRQWYRAARVVQLHGTVPLGPMLFSVRVQLRGSFHGSAAALPRLS